MARPSRKSRRTATEEVALSLVQPLPPLPNKPAGPLKGLTPNQGLFIKALRTHQISFGVGSAGTGKSYVAAAVAADMLRDGEVERIVVTRPCVGAEDDIGALPGTLDEKIAPYLAPIRSILEERLGAGAVKYMIEHGKIVALPVNFLRGHSFNDAFVLADEAQNLTKRQFKLLLTRLGRNSRIAITGDSNQADIPNSGLDDALTRLLPLPAVAIVTFTRGDVVRHSVVAEILQAYDAP